jgi:DNA-binding NarL/FixJ family response regulator
MTDDGNRLKILLVDDEMLVRAGTAMMLDELGHEVTDFRMPEMDGVALIAEVERVQPNASIVLMTGYEADDPRFESLRCTNLAKPFGLSELEEAIAASKAAS